ncbi:MAG: cytochrome P450 [Candidatus Dormibacteraeota bacterium]|nr:cytochrome P450 [Candidatus Dormibacteraeota bacterium]MBO0760712.1 cytochrome P450 [Candidatus Dormibacteraeota bacterium]
MASSGSDPTGTVLAELLSPAGLADPYPVYRRLREERARGLDLGRLVIDHAQALAVLADRTLSSDRVTTTLKPLAAAERGSLDPLERTLRAIVAFTDPPDHGRLRRLLQGAFTPAVVRENEPAIRRLAEGLLDDLAGSAEVDLQRDFSYRLPALVVGSLLGVEPARERDFARWARQIVVFFGTGRPDLALAQETREQLVEARAYLGKLAERRRHHPTGDLLSAMVGSQEPEGGLTEDELLANALFLMTAGHETVANQITNGLVSLLRHPDQAELLRRDPALIDGAVEEILRFDSAIQLTARLAERDRLVLGRRLAKGEAVVVLLGAANRDPARFPEPDRFDIRRAGNRPLSFAFGAHYCLGAALARAELRIGIPLVLERLGALDLQESELTYQPTLDFRGPTSLRVRRAGVPFAAGS